MNRQGTEYPLVSIIIPTYNNEARIARTLNCLIEQDYSNIEIIVVNDVSTDATADIARRVLMDGGRPFNVIDRSVNGGQSASRNTGLDAARGEYVAFVDDDDRAAPDYLEFLLKLLTDNDADVAICGATDKAFDEKRIMSPEEAVIELLRRERFHTGFPTKLFRRELLDRLRFSEEGAFEDVGLMYRVLARASRVAYHGLPKYRARRHPGNVSAWTTNHALLTPEILDEYRRAYRARTEWLSARFPDSAAAFRYFEWSFLLSMVEKIERLNLRDCAAQREAMAAELSAHRAEFLAAPELRDFEQEWMGKYS